MAGGDMIAHVKAGELDSITGTAVPGVSAQLPPTVGKASARRNQLAHVRGRAPAFSGADLTGTELLVSAVVWCASCLPCFSGTRSFSVLLQSATLLRLHVLACSCAHQHAYLDHKVPVLNVAYHASPHALFLLILPIPLL